MSLKQITDAVAAELADAGVTVTIEFGGENAFRLDAPPRLIWIPKSSQGGPPEKGGFNPRPLRTRNVTVEAHVWAKSDAADATSADHFAAAEDLLNSVAAAVHRVAMGSYEFIGETWPVENDELLAHGRVVIATFVFRIPITDTLTGTATPTQATQTAEITVPR